MAKGTLNRTPDIGSLNAGDVGGLTDSQVLESCHRLGVKVLDAGGQARAALRERLRQGTAGWEPGKTRCRHCGSPIAKVWGVRTDASGRRYREVRCSGPRKHRYTLYEAD